MCVCGCCCWMWILDGEELEEVRVRTEEHGTELVFLSSRTVVIKIQPPQDRVCVLLLTTDTDTGTVELSV